MLRVNNGKKDAVGYALARISAGFGVIFGSAVFAAVLFTTVITMFPSIMHF